MCVVKCSARWSLRKNRFWHTRHSYLIRFKCVKNAVIKLMSCPFKLTNYTYGLTPVCRILCLRILAPLENFMLHTSHSKHFRATVPLLLSVFGLSCKLQNQWKGKQIYKSLANNTLGFLRFQNVGQKQMRIYRKKASVFSPATVTIHVYGWRWSGHRCRWIHSRLCCILSDATFRACIWYIHWKLATRSRICTVRITPTLSHVHQQQCMRYRFKIITSIAFQCI